MRYKNTVAGLSMLTIAIVLLMVFTMNGAFSGSQTENQIVTGEITDETILETDLAAVDAAVDEDCIIYVATVDDFEWQTCGAD